MTASTYDVTNCTMTDIASDGTDKAIAEVRDINDGFKDRLGQLFRFPAPADRDGWLRAIEDAQNLYELAKRTETAIVPLVATIDENGFREFEDGITRLVEAAPKKPDGTSTLARTPAEKLVEVEPGYVEHKNRLLDAKAEKGHAEKWHSIAYQRLETLREVFRKL